MNLPGEGADATKVTPAVKKMRLRYAGVCRSCSADLPTGTAGRAPVLDQARTAGVASIVQPMAAPEPTSIIAVNDAVPSQPGIAGASARREFERRRPRPHQARTAGLMLAVSDEPQSTRAWAVGATGEETLGRRLDELASSSVRVLHDRRIPRTRANIDHIVICPAGVVVVDAKQYKGRPHRRVEGGLFVPRTERLMVGSRDGSKLVDGVLVAADWPLFGGAFTTRGVTALWPKKLAGVIAEPGRLTETEIRGLHAQLAKAFPVA